MITKPSVIRSIARAIVPALIVTLIVAQTSAQERTSNGRQRIGIYDSRAVAVAFVRSPAHTNQMAPLLAEHRKAKESGDGESVRRLEAAGKAMQEKIHLQAFSTEPVDDLLQHITNALPEIQKTARVSALISRWDEPELKKYPNAERVDVTWQLIDAFQPTPRQRQSAVEIQKKKPVPLEQARRMRH
jgi:hypothetical protein